MVLVLAALGGFVGSGGATSRVAIITVLLALFVAVFIIALGYSMVMDPNPFEPEFGSATIRQSYAEAPSVQQEAVYGSS